MDLLHIFLENGCSVTTDTRKIKNGDIFFALKGPNHNANLYAKQAIEKGASYAVVDEDTDISLEKKIKVDNVLLALQNLARAYRRYLNIPVFALTGSNGKTTSKELIAAVLKNKFNLNYTQGNLNNEIGVPLTILNTKSSNDFLIIEMGANHQGEINFLCEIAEPNFGLITNIGKAHLEGFGGIEGVKRGKSEIYRYLASHNGIIFINQDDKVLNELLPVGANIIKFSSTDFDVIENDPFLKIRYEAMEISTHLSGEYNVYNIATSFAIGHYFGIGYRDMIKSIESYSPNNNRSQVIDYNGIKIIMDAYNANPTSLDHSIKSFLNDDAANKVVIIGDMFELGEYAKDEHNKIIELVSNYEVYKAIFVGENFYQFHNSNKYEFYKNTQEAKSKIDFNNLKGYQILIKGSRGMALENLIK